VQNEAGDAIASMPRKDAALSCMRAQRVARPRTEV
jgi:hypothetical protein